jgi:antitoxin YefM
MLAVKSMDVRDNFKKICDKVFDGETIIVSRPKNENVVMLSEKEYNELQKAKRNTEYLAMLDKSIEQAKQGKTISFTMKELEAMESVDWKPTDKVLNFMEKMKNE